jgi:hypothetical protein
VLGKRRTSLAFVSYTRQVGDLINVIRQLALMLPTPLRHALLLLPSSSPPPLTSATADGKAVTAGGSGGSAGSSTPPGPAAFPPTSPTTSLMVWGCGVLLASNVVCIAGRSLPFYMVGLTLLGLGWAWVYVSASSLVTGEWFRE